MNSGKQEHDGESPIGLHKALGPHGLGEHGSVCCVKTGSSIISEHLVKGSPVVFGGQLQTGE